MFKSGKYWGHIFYVLLASLYNLVNKANLVHSLFINLYMFWATMCPSSPSCTLHTSQSSTQNNKYHVSHKHSCLSWWWAHSCREHVEKSTKHMKKICAPSWLYLQKTIRRHLWPCCCLQELCSSYSCRYLHQNTLCLWLWNWSYCRLSGWAVMQNSGSLYTLGLLMPLCFERRWIWTPFCVYSTVGFVYNSLGSNSEYLAIADC